MRQEEASKVLESGRPTASLTCLKDNFFAVALGVKTNKWESG